MAVKTRYKTMFINEMRFFTSQLRPMLQKDLLLFWKLQLSSFLSTP
jgi:hypothetical protein